ncbi:restriction endonuclease subunit S [Lactococcus formosensis]|uniref:Restriction endonuclease subunit S n=1 Tax=Lactococcus formosensis TaxID=1281486 RepID=A0A9X4P177_9LACT|nr:restriction endonuclease subunit S [Lactococcus formosensis]MCO7181208.1 restriction endonuclease subunit S [Lactococcus formosensis]MDG6130285.1 restriction endonuclease subunit S [Lactococcus formosensis]MDG6146041.1 restriction endonuclease subunit S [Lactococcus formosensis]MDG6165125.1 restriction endonuclease subunit S [Lactococcus formosensis]MDG6169271.1 restriction endonuclease subunit S [Lactococcus formosensis]
MNDKNLGSQKNKLKKIKKSPELRFKGFSDDWEQRKLGELGNLNRGKSKHRPRNDSRLFGGEYPFIQTGDVAKAPLFLTEYSQTYSEFGIQQSKLWDIGTLLITIAANVADTTILGIKAAFPDSVIGFESTSCDVVFIKNYIDIQSDLLKRKAETSSQANLNLAKLKEMSLNVPKLKEQQKIGSFFKQLDDTIALHQRKLDKLKQLKQGYLQKLFPNLGENIPKFRFAYFEDVWEQRKLSEIVKITMGQSPNSENYTTNPDDYILVQGNADMKNGRVFPRVWTTQITKIAEKNDLILSVRAPVGDIGKTDYNVVLGRGVAAIKGNEFIFQLLGKMKQNGYWTKLSTGSTFESINSVDIKNAQILLPSGKEQIQIGYFFQLLDNTIFLHQSKLDKLKTIKKSLLQKMFI